MKTKQLLEFLRRQYPTAAINFCKKSGFIAVRENNKLLLEARTYEREE